MYENNAAEETMEAGNSHAGLVKALVALAVILGILVGGGALLSSGLGLVGESRNTPKIVGMPLIETPVDDAIIDGFKAKMEELGYEEGRDIVYDRQVIRRGPNANNEARLVIREMVARDYDLLLVSREEVPIALEETANAGKSTPIVFTQGDTTLRQSLVGFDSSGANVTGVFVPMEDVAGKQMEFLRRLFPDAKTIGYFGDGYLVSAGNPPGPVFEAAMIKEGARFGFEFAEFTTDVPPGPALREEMERTLDAIGAAEVDAWIHLPAHFVADQQVLEGAFAKRLGIPFIVPGLPEIMPGGGEGLISYSADYGLAGSQAAVMVDKIFNGTDPADIPIEFPREMFLAFNLTTAEAIGFEIPADIRALADLFVR